MRKFEILQSGKADIESKLKEMLNLFASNGVLLAYLHGGYAKGRVGPLSDIDIAVLFDTDDKKEIWKLAGEVHDGLSHILKRDDVDLGLLNGAPPLFRFEVVKGKLLFARDEETRVRFVWRAISEYLDTKHIWETYRRYLYKDIREGKFIGK